MATIDFTDVTNATTPTDGTGVFDSLMETLNIHIEDQYKKNRIKSTDYASVYLGAMQSAMAESIQFVLQKQLTEAQIQDTEFNRNLALYKTNLDVIEDLYKAKQLSEISDNVVGKTELDELYEDVKNNRSI